jgi:tetratricopeptide (TPR) repeat protein
MHRRPIIILSNVVGLCVLLAAGGGRVCADAPAAVPNEPLVKGIGNVHHSVTTKSAEAQRYFDQGLAFVYAFNHDEAEASFREAARLDPNLAMAYWGEALALGPNINLPEDDQRGREAFGAISKAKSLESGAGEEERAYIDALSKRYASDGKMRPEQQRAYADAMRELWKRHSDDPDAGALFAESLMDLHPWNLWTHDGKPVEGTEEITATLEAVLAKHPDHIGANHYYIHAVEASPHPERALKCAERLGKLAPEAGHLVHMPSHIYIRTGRYHQSELANAQAVKVDRAYIAERHPTGVYPMMYYPHNLQFLWMSYLFEGNRRGGERAARDLLSVVTPQAVHEMPMAEAAEPVMFFTAARFGDWDAILAEPAPPADLAYTNGIRHYARGLAFAAKGQTSDAEAELKQLDAIEASLPESRMAMFASQKQLLKVASETLAGEIASREGHHDDAISHLREAVALQDALPYEEPPAWYYPVRETLGAELLAQGKAVEAERVYREDLRRNPDNGWSLFGLAECLRARKDDRAAAQVDAEFKKAWAHADVKLGANGVQEASAATR